MSKKSSLFYVVILASYITFILLRVKMGLRVFLTSLQLCPPFKVKRFDFQIMSLYEVPLSQFIPPMFLSSKWSKSLTIGNIFDVIKITDNAAVGNLTQYVLHKIQISYCQNWLARDRRICAIILVATKLLVLLLDYFMNTALIVKDV